MDYTHPQNLHSRSSGCSMFTEWEL